MTKRALHGWLNLYKPYGMTSTQAVGAVKRLLRPEKIGHAGTLDPLAEGILPLALGEATKTVPYMMDARKTYQFTIGWGEARDTDDAEGTVIARSDIRPISDEIVSILPRFIGEIEQIPPAYSALKIDGKRAYDLARAGKNPEMKSRKVRIDTLELVKAEENQASFEVTCGKGTYIRSLARDIAQGLGTVGYVSALRRSRVGVFDAADAISLDFLEKLVHNPTFSVEKLLAETLKPLSTALDDIPALTVDRADSHRLRQGQAISSESSDNTVMVALFHAETLVAIGERRGHEIVPKRVFNHP